jgi:hypothetical protein
MSDATKPCPLCGKKANLLPAGTYRQNEFTWALFDNDECRGWRCSNPRCSGITGAPVGIYNSDPGFGLKSLDEVLTP